MHGAPTAHGGGGTVTALAVQNDAALAKYPTFEHVVELIRQRRDGVLRVHIEEYVRLANYQPGRIEFVPAPGAPKDLSQKLGSQLQRWTGSRWAVILVNEGGAPSIAEIRDAAKNEMREQALGHPLVQAVMEAFPKSKIKEIKSRRDIANEALAEALPEVEDEWDPFEE
jgi:DNA polymerase-3 subunit gamma/tau